MNDNNEWKHFSEIDIDKMINYFICKAELNINIKNSENYFQVLNSLKTFYEKNYDEILETYKESKHIWFDDYPTDWSKCFTKIEYQAWDSIRRKGKIVLYPQYPVKNYFLDFANPGLKICIELDGKEFHDEAKDKLRDEELKELGWTIFRITGKEMCRTNYLELYELEEADLNIEEIRHKLSYWLLETGDGVIEAIREIYFQDDEDFEFDCDENEYEDNYEITKLNDIRKIYYELCRNTIEKHKS